MRRSFVRLYSASVSNFSIQECKLLASLGKTKQIPESISFFNSLVDQGKTPTVDACQILMRTLVTNQEHKDAERFFMKLDSLNITPNSSLFSLILRSYVEKGDSYKAIKFLDKHHQREDFQQLEPIDYNAFMKTLISNNEIDAAEDFLRSPYTPSLDLPVYQRLIKFYDSKGKYQSLFDLIQFYRRNGHDIPPQQYGKWITLFTSSKLQSLKAMNLLYSMVEEGKEPNNIAITQVFNSLLDDKRFKEIFSFFEFLKKKKNLQPNVITFTSLIDKSLKRGYIEFAEKMIAKMRDMNIKLNVVTYNSLFSYLVKNEKYTKAEQWFSQMIAENIEPNQKSLHSMLNLYSSSNNTKGLNLFLEKMGNLGLRKDEFTYSIQIKGLLNSLSFNTSVFNQITTILWDMKENNINIDTTICNQIIHCLLKNDKMDEAKVFTKEMKRLGISFDVATLNTIMRWLNIHKKYKSSISCWQKLRKQNISPDKSSYFNILEAYSSLQQANEIHKIFGEAQTILSHIPSDLFSCFVSSFVKVKEFDFAYDMVIKCKELYNQEPTNSMYCIIMEDLFKQNNSTDAVQLFEDMKNLEVKPDIISYNVLFAGFARHHDTESGLKYWKELEESNQLKPDIVSFNTMIKLFVHSGNMKQALHFWDKLHHYGLRPDKYTYVQFLIGYKNQKNTSEAQTTEYEMKIRNIPLSTEDEIKHPKIELKQ